MRRKRKQNKHPSLKEEASAFDRQAIARLTHGFIPDLQRLKKVPYFYNNPWREPEFYNIQIKPRIDFVLRAASVQKRQVLEIGCGTGFLSLEMARLGCHVTGIDVSPKSIAVARHFRLRAERGKNFGKLEYVVGDIMKLNLKPEVYDSIVFLGSLHHFAKPEVLLKRAAAMLKPKGSVVVCEPVRESFTRDAAAVAGLLRSVLETWIPYKEKIKDTDTHGKLNKYIDRIFDEYTYKYEHQSPNDNLTASESTMINAIKKYFTIKAYERADAFSDKLIGGLRGPNRYTVAKILKRFDDYMVKENVLPATSIRIWAAKK